MVMIEGGSRGQSESKLNFETGRAIQTAEILFDRVFMYGAEVDITGIASDPHQPTSHDQMVAESLEGGRIARIFTTLQKGGRRQSFIIPPGSRERLSLVPPYHKGSSSVELITVDKGLAIAIPVSCNFNLMQYLKQAYLNELKKHDDFDKNAVTLYPSTIVKEALRNIAEYNGTNRDVAARLMREYEAGEEPGWKEAPSRAERVRGTLSKLRRKT